MEYPISDRLSSTRFSDHAPRPFEGPLEVNTELRRAELLFPGELVQPETFVKDEKGKEDGKREELMIHWQPTHTHTHTRTHTCTHTHTHTHSHTHAHTHTHTHAHTHRVYLHWVR